MRRFAALAITIGAAAWSAQGAVVTYSLGGVGDNGTQISGSFSFDDGVIGANYAGFYALGDLLTFSVTLSSIPNTPTTTTFTKADGAPDYDHLFQLATDSSGAVVEFSPGFAPNSDGYFLDPTSEFSANLEKTGDPFPTDYNLVWTYTQVPELSHTALGAGLGLLGFAGYRAWRNRR